MAALRPVKKMYVALGKKRVPIPALTDLYDFFMAIKHPCLLFSQPLFII